VDGVKVAAGREVGGEVPRLPERNKLCCVLFNIDWKKWHLWVLSGTAWCDAWEPDKSMEDVH
jgi:hypothetical protein